MKHRYFLSDFILIQYFHYLGYHYAGFISIFYFHQTEHFHHIANKISSRNFSPYKFVYVTNNENVFNNQGKNMPTCSNHEESDTRIIVQLVHTLSLGHKIFEIRTVDSDIILISIGIYHKLVKDYSLKDIYILYGTGKNIKRYSIKSICNSLGESKSKSVVVLHAISGCDDVSGFRRKEEFLEGVEIIRFYNSHFPRYLWWSLHTHSHWFWTVQQTSKIHRSCIFNHILHHNSQWSSKGVLLP